MIRALRAPQWCLLLLSTAVTTATLAGTPRLVRHSPHKAESYFVVLNDDTAAGDVDIIARDLAKKQGVQPRSIWNRVLKGFSMTAREVQAIAVSRDPRVRFVEEDYESAGTSADSPGEYGTPTDLDPGCAMALLSRSACHTSDDRLWHLNRISHDGPPDQNGGDRNYEYCCDGQGVRVYAIDGGAMRAHSGVGSVDDGRDYTGPVRSDALDASAADPCSGDFTLSADEMTAHGTGVASLINGPALGVAKKAIVVPLRVIRCDRPYRPSYPYEKNAIMTNGIARYYAATDGTTSAAVGTAFGDVAHPVDTVLDGTVTWKRLAPPLETQTEMMIGAFNDLPNVLALHHGQPAVVTLSTYVVACASNGTNCKDPNSSAFATAVTNFTNSNDVLVIAAANNQGLDACNTLPAALSKANAKVLAVGGTMLVNDPNYSRLGVGALHGDNDREPFPAGYDPYDSRWICGAGDSDVCTVGISPDDPTSHTAYVPTTVGSNFGECVSLFAPAKNIPVASMGGKNKYRDSRGKNAQASGTSWAAPITAGVAARFLSMRPLASAADVRSALINTAIPDVIDPFTIRSPNNLLLRASDVMWVRQPDPSPAIVPANSATTITFDAAAPAGAMFTLYRGARGDRSAAVVGPKTLPAHATNETITATTTSPYWIEVTGTCPSDGHSFQGASREFVIHAASCSTPPIVNPISFSGTPNPYILPGASVTLTANVATSGSWTYQWYAGSTTFAPITGATNSSIPVTPQQTTSYFVRVAAAGNPSCYVDSEPAKVPVLAAPTATATALTAETSLSPFGTPIALTVRAEGRALDYAWCAGQLSVCTPTSSGFNNGCSSRTCRVAGDVTSTFTVTVSNDAGSLTRSITITGCDSPIHITPPIDAIYHPRDQAATITVMNPTAAYTYNWYYGVAGDMGHPLGCSGNSCTLDILPRDEFVWVRVSNGSCFTDVQYTVKALDCTMADLNVRTFGIVNDRTTILIESAAPDDYDYQWYEGTAVDPAKIIFGSNFPYRVVATPSTYANYTIQVTPKHGTCTRTLLATIACPAPRRRAVAQPTATVPRGAPVLLSIDDYGDTASVDWYTGPDVDHLSPNSVGSGASITVYPTETTTYWASLTSKCSASTKSFSYSATIVALDNTVLAYATTDVADSLLVTVAWSASYNAVQYQLQRSASWNGSFTDVGATTTGLVASDRLPATIPATFVYRVIAIDANGNRSTGSNRDYATVASALFADSSVSAGATAVRAQHIRDLRTAIDKVREAAGIGAGFWWQPLTTVTASSFTELRAYLNEARTTMGLPNYPFTSSLSTVKAADIDELRNSVR